MTATNPLYLQRVASIVSAAQLLDDEAMGIPGVYNVDTILRHLREDASALERMRCRTCVEGEPLPEPAAPTVDLVRQEVWTS